MKDIIAKFENEYDFLSNFYEAPCMFEGLSYESTEASFQSAKTIDLELRKEFASLKPGKAKRKGREIALRANWDSIRNNIMYECVKDKFTRNIDLQEKLLNTGDSILIEGNYWHDTYWGVCDGVGENNLGKILMQIRGELSEGISIRQKED